MSDSHVYCCSRCGDIFESETDEVLCVSCRVVLQRSRAQTGVYEHVCERCGEKYMSKGKTARFCMKCREEIRKEKAKAWNDRERGRGAYKPKVKAAEPPKKLSIAQICKIADERGISYGTAVALMDAGKL